MQYVHTDHLGAPQKMTDYDRAVVWDAAFTPFGEEDSILGGGSNDQRFPGQFFDAESGLYYNYFRDYDPALGRYLQSDPIGLAGGLNTYAYVGGNPVGYVDPSGLITLTFGGTVALGTGSVSAGFAFSTPGFGGEFDFGFFGNISQTAEGSFGGAVGATLDGGLHAGAVRDLSGRQFSTGFMVPAPGLPVPSVGAQAILDDNGKLTGGQLSAGGGLGVYGRGGFTGVASVRDLPALIRWLLAATGATTCQGAVHG